MTQVINKTLYNKYLKKIDDIFEPRLNQIAKKGYYDDDLYQDKQKFIDTIFADNNLRYFEQYLLLKHFNDKIDNL